MMQHLQVRVRHLRELGAGRQQRVDASDVTRADGIDEALYRRAVDECLELRPALESVGTGDHQLRVVQRESRRGRRRDNAR